MDDDKGFPAGLVFVIVFIVFFLSFIMGFSAAEWTYKPAFRKWDIEQEYIQYNPKTGDLEVINNDIEPIEHLLK